jgi:hypothetical protein
MTSTKRKEQKIVSGDTTWWMLDGKLHKSSGPAEIVHTSKSLRNLRWYKHGALHRTGGPAVITNAPVLFGARLAWYINGDCVWVYQASPFEEADPNPPAEWPYKLDKRWQKIVDRYNVRAVHGN